MTTDTVIEEKTKQTLKEPPKFKVIVFNDDFTPVEFVIALLVHVFNKDQVSATELTLQIHNEGKCIVGIYSHEIAEQKVSDATKMSRAHGHPLVIKSEAE
jgi:ATP-dependent Clp protease adaptor protein ClpS